MPPSLYNDFITNETKKKQYKISINIVLCKMIAKYKLSPHRIPQSAIKFIRINPNLKLRT